jgi:flavin-dependent dehydrogenase
MHEGRANVGIGMLSSVVSKKKINLKSTLNQLLLSYPVLRERFKHAKPLEYVKGHGLPLGSKKRTLSGERFLLLGDAAGLIDPFTGEGIGNAIRSGRVAADHLKKAFAHQNFSANFNKAYDNEIYQKMWNEFRVSKALQRLCAYPTLFNFVFRKAKQSKYLHDFLIKALADIDQKKQFLNPLFYYRLFFS